MESLASFGNRAMYWAITMAPGLVFFRLLIVSFIFLLILNLRVPRAPRFRIPESEHPLDVFTPLLPNHNNAVYRYAFPASKWMSGVYLRIPTKLNTDSGGNPNGIPG
jgi:hypothetical protein